MTDKKIRKQVMFNTTPEMHYQIKELALRLNITMDLLMFRAITAYINEKTKYDKVPEKHN